MQSKDNFATFVVTPVHADTSYGKSNLSGPGQFREEFGTKNSIWPDRKFCFALRSLYR